MNRAFRVASVTRQTEQRETCRDLHTRDTAALAKWHRAAFEKRITASPDAPVWLSLGQVYDFINQGQVEKSAVGPPARDDIPTWAHGRFLTRDLDLKSPTYKVVADLQSKSVVPRATSPHPDGPR